MSIARKIVWTLLMAILVGLLYVAFRGYLTPAMLIDFATGWTC